MAGMKLTGAEDLSLALKNVAFRSSDKMRRGLRKGAKVIESESIKNAPVDTGDLESGHEIVEKIGDKNRIEIDINVSSTHAGYDYAMEMHEGDYELGPKSTEKDSRGSNKVGPKYLERAFEDNKDDIMKDIAAELRKIF